MLAGTLDPFDSVTQRRTNGYSFTASLPTGRHTLSLSGNTFASSTVFNPIVTETLFVVPSFTAVNAHQLQLADVIKSSDKLALNANITSANTSGIGSSFLGGGGATWTPTTNDTVQFGAAYGSAQPGSIAPHTLSDPDAARFVCASGTTVVYGPPDPPQHQFSASYNAGWTHTWGNSQLTVDAYRQSQLGQTISGLISAAGEPPGFLPGGYIDRLEQAWAQPTVCGNATFSPMGIYVIQPISGTARMYQGIDASARVQLGQYVMLLPTYALNIAMLVAGDPRLTVPLSPMIVGSQLPGRPIHRAGLTVDGLIPRYRFRAARQRAIHGREQRALSHAVHDGRGGRLAKTWSRPPHRLRHQSLQYVIRHILDVAICAAVATCGRWQRFVRRALTHAAHVERQLHARSREERGKRVASRRAGGGCCACCRQRRYGAK